MIEPRLIVTVAPDREVTLPHASGIRELPGRVVRAGETFETTRSTAKDLLAAGLILDAAAWVRDAAKPPEPTERGVTVWNGSGRPRALLDGEVADLTGGVPEHLGHSSENRAPSGPVPPHNCVGPPTERVR